MSWRETFGQLARTIDTVFPGDRDLDALFAKGRPLRVKLGIDITSTSVTIGNGIPLRILARFQELGHVAVLILGDFTTLVGDPSGRDKTRPVLTPEEVVQNGETWLEQIKGLLDLDRAEVRRNGEWLAKLDSSQLLTLSSQLTVAQMLERDSFATRYRAGSPIHLHEFLYCLFQGYDSIAVNADVELGGTDQTFNVNMGRVLQKNAGMRPQVCVTNPLLEGVDGHKKMSKSVGNSICLDTPAKDMFGLATRIPDELIEKYLRLATDLADETIADLGRGDPWNAKKSMAEALTARHYGAETAARERTEFERVFAEKKLPEDIPEYVAPPGRTVLELVRGAFSMTSGEAKRLIKQGAVTVAGNKMTDASTVIEHTDGDVLRAGKRRFASLRVGPS